MPIMVCRICGMEIPGHRQLEFESHVKRCYERNQDVVDMARAPVLLFGDPELAAFARAEGDVYNRRPGTRRRPR